MDEEKAKKILKQFERLKNERRAFEPLWEECMWNIAPVMQSFDAEKPKDAYRIPKRISNKPANYLNTCVSGIAGYSMSPSMPWFRLSLIDPETAERPSVIRWLSDCQRVMRRAFERCGFYTKSIQWLENGAMFGQSAMLIEELSNKDAPVRYHVPENVELYLDDGETGETETVFRSYWTTVENLADFYGLKALHEKMRKRYEDAKDKDAPEEPVQIVHAVFKRRTGKPDFSESRANKKYAGYIIDFDNKHVIHETGYDEFPYAVFFWEKRGKPYGISPVMKSINDIKLFMEATETLLTVAEYSANPPKNVPVSMKGNENFQPGGYNYLRSGDQPASQIDVGANYPITVQITQAMEQGIKDWFNVDFFLMLRQQSALQNMTATAVTAMQGEQTALLSALVSNLYGGLSKIIERTFNILAKKRMLPPMPFELQALGGAMKIDFLGVLAQAQKAAYEYAGVMDVLGIANSFAQMGKIDPQWARAVNWLNPEQVFKKAVESRGAPADVLRTEEEYNKIVGGLQARDDAMTAAENQAANQQAVLQNAQNLNQKVQPGSMLQGLLG